METYHAIGQDPNTVGAIHPFKADEIYGLDLADIFFYRYVCGRAAERKVQIRDLKYRPRDEAGIPAISTSDVQIRRQKARDQSTLRWCNPHTFEDVCFLYSAHSCPSKKGTAGAPEPTSIARIG